MFDFNQSLNKTLEVGYVKKINKCLIWADGLPSGKIGEIVVFENGSIGQIIALGRKLVEILTFSHALLTPGTKVARTDEFLNVPCDKSLLGQTIDPLGNSLFTKKTAVSKELRPIDITPPGVLQRKISSEPLETGVPLIDLVIPLAKGQRELVLGDKKTGKTSFLLRALYNQAKKGTICIYANIGKREVETTRIEEFLKETGIRNQVCLVTTNAASPEGQIIIAPFTAMTIAEFFRDEGHDVLLILDDLTTHAKFYREVSLLARKFPGRNSYPGDIFYEHSRIFERAGRFPKGTITCLGVGETIYGDLSGYMQTNLMSMTDGHIYFDSEYADLGRHPAINPFLSVTRIGYQAQSELVRNTAGELAKFLLHNEKLRDLLHFGGELSEKTKENLELGDRILQFFDIPESLIIPQNFALFGLAWVWSGLGKGKDKTFLHQGINAALNKYQTDETFRKEIENLPLKYTTFKDLTRGIEPWISKQ